MKKFVEDVVVRRKFVETCEKPIDVEEPKKLKVFHPREPDTYTMDDLRILASCLVREEVSFKHGVNQDFFGNSIYRPEWWPDNVKFQCPHERQKGCSLSHADLGKIIDAYRGYRHLITTDDHQQQQNCDDSRAYDQMQTQEQNGDDCRAYDQMQTQLQNDALRKLTPKKRWHNCVQSRPRTMDVQEFLQHKNYAEVGRMLSSATWEVFLNLVQVIASMLPKVTERLRSSLEHDKCVSSLKFSLQSMM